MFGIRRIVPCLRWLVVLLALSTPVLGPDNRGHAATGRGNDIVAAAFDAAPITLDPAVSYDSAGAFVLRAAYEGLVRMRGSSTTAIEGVLATSWSADARKTVWTFQLRHGVFFHDGTPFNAAAVKFNIERTLAINQAPAFVIGQFLTPAGIKVLGPYTIQFHLNGPAPRFLYALASPYGQWIVSPTAVQKHTVKNDRGQTWLASHEAGSGAYMFSQVMPKHGITLVRFPKYWRGWSGHHVQQVALTYVLQDATRRALVERDGVDISLDFTPEDLIALKGDHNVVVDDSYGFINTMLIPTEYGPFADRRARLALEYAFDYHALIKGLLKGFARRAQGPLPRAIYGHDSALPLYQTDLHKARQLLTAAGVKPGTTVTLMYPVQDERLKDIALVAQGQLSRIGLNVALQPRDGTTYFNMLLGTEPIAQRPNLWAGLWYPDYNDAIDWLSPLYHSKDASGGGAANGGMYHNAQVDRLLARASVTLDAAQQRRLLAQVQEILTLTDPAVVPVAEIPNSTVYSSKLHGYYDNPVYTQTYDFYALWKG
jgi:peptide/nickel transport system substrate-binding protein